MSEKPVKILVAGDTEKEIAIAKNVIEQRLMDVEVDFVNSRRKIILRM